MPNKIRHGLLAAVLAAMLSLTAHAAVAPRIEPSVCPPSLRDWFRCGVLLVPERVGASASPTLRLPYAVRAAGARPTRNALTFLNGGPGLSELRVAPTVARALEGLPEDMVFLERRGLGLSTPAFTCRPGVRTGAGRWNIPAALKCRDHWRAAGYDLNAYDTAAAAGDLETLRRFLGYQQWDLYGISYGTAYAFSVMRDYPESVHSALLDSVYPYGLDPFHDNVAKHFAKFDKVFAACAAQPVCAADYPDLHAQLITAIQRAAATPLMTAEGPLDGRALLDRMAHALDETDLLGKLPAIVAAAARGDGAAFSRLDVEFDASTQPAAGFPVEVRAAGIWPVIECRERFSRHRGVTESVEGWPRKLVETLDVEWGPGEAVLCRAWGAAPAPAAIDRPISRSIPTLIMVGEFDPQTTPEWAARAAAVLPRGAAQVAVVPNVAHVTTVSPCGRNLAMQFLAASETLIDRTCLGDASPLAFLRR